MAEYPKRSFPLWAEGGPGPPVLDKRCAVGPGCIESSVQGVCSEDEKGSWTASGTLLSRFRSCVPLSKQWDDFGILRPVWAPWGHNDLEDIPIANIVTKAQDSNVISFKVESKHKYSPVIITNAARHANRETSKFIRCRLWEKSMMESIQSPKLWMHCSRWRTTPLQKISLFFSGFDLQLWCRQHTQECEPFFLKRHLWASLPVR